MAIGQAIEARCRRGSLLEISLLWRKVVELFRLTWRRAGHDDLAKPTMNWFRVLTRMIERRRLHPVSEASFQVFCLESSEN